MVHHTLIENDLTIGPYFLEQVDDFIYLRVNINHKNDLTMKLNLG
jgi:hypothetical protein